jgi:hypothetical protein
MESVSSVAQQIPISLLLIFVQNWLKQQKWFPVIGYDTAKANHLFSILTTGLATLGVHFAYSSVDHSLTITGLSLAAIGTAAWHWLQQYALTKGLYTGLQNQLNPTAAQQPTAVAPVESVPSAETVAAKKNNYDIS